MLERVAQTQPPTIPSSKPPPHPSPLHKQAVSFSDFPNARSDSTGFALPPSRFLPCVSFVCVTFSLHPLFFHRSHLLPASHHQAPPTALLPAKNPPHSIFQRGGKVLIRWEVMLWRREKEESFAKWDLLPAISHNRKGNEAADNSCHSLLDNLGMIRSRMHAEAHRASPARLKAKRRKGLSAESARGTAAV